MGHDSCCIPFACLPNLGVRQYLVLIEDDHIDEEGDEIEDLFRMEDVGSNEAPDSSDDDSDDSSETEAEFSKNGSSHVSHF